MSTRCQEILEIEISNASLAQPWLETLLHIRGLGNRTTFFGRSDVVNKGSAAILPVFFGRKPACLVDDACFAVMRELNPQVGTVRKLRTQAGQTPFHALAGSDAAPPTLAAPAAPSARSP